MAELSLEIVQLICPGKTSLWFSDNLQCLASPHWTEQILHPVNARRLATVFTFTEKILKVHGMKRKLLMTENQPKLSESGFWISRFSLLPLKICRKHSYFVSSKHYKAYLYIYVVVFRLKNISAVYGSEATRKPESPTLFSSHTGLIKSVKSPEYQVEGQILPSLSLYWYTLHTKDNY